jgi:exosortase/archaeosortase family protein
MVIAFAMLFFTFVHRMESKKTGFLWMAFSLVISYLSTIFANGIRITLAIIIKDLVFINRLLGADRAHTAIGVAVYFVSLLALFQIVDNCSRKGGDAADTLASENICHRLFADDRGRSSLQQSKPVNIFTRLLKCAPPLFWYFTFTLAIPLINGAYKNDGARFAGYAMLIFAICLATVLIYFLANRRLLMYNRAKRLE